MNWKKVTIRFPIDVEIEVPEDWDKDMIEMVVYVIELMSGQR